MRLDKYLKVSRLIKRRTVANEACDNGLVTVNGKPARASYDVKPGDQISLRFGVRTITVEVLSIQETVRQADAGTLAHVPGDRALKFRGRELAPSKKRQNAGKIRRSSANDPRGAHISLPRPI